jgi:uncharacterized RDD family membrane protein YckC
MTNQPPPPPPPGNYPPPPPPPGGYPPPPSGPGSHGGGFAHQGGGFAHQGGGFAPQGGGFAPQGGGYPPPPPQGGYGYASVAQGPVAALPQEAYTPWLTRVLAWLIDSVPIFIVYGIGWLLLIGTRETACITDTSQYDLGEFCATGASTLGQVSMVIAWLVVLAYVIWNYGYRQGTTGSSIGKSIMKFKVVSEKTGQPIGFGMSVVRQIAHIVDSVICYIGYLFPLWDKKRQTLADKIMTTVCLPL